MKIEKRSFDATDNEVIIEIYRVVRLLISVRITPYLSKVKTELRCSEADLIALLHRHRQYFTIKHDSKGKPAIVITPLLDGAIKTSLASQARRTNI